MGVVPGGETSPPTPLGLSGMGLLCLGGWGRILAVMRRLLVGVVLLVWVVSASAMEAGRVVVTLGDAEAFAQSLSEISGAKERLTWDDLGIRAMDGAPQPREWLSLIKDMRLEWTPNESAPLIQLRFAEAEDGQRFLGALARHTTGIGGGSLSLGRYLLTIQDTVVTLRPAWMRMPKAYEAPQPGMAITWHHNEATTAMMISASKVALNVAGTTTLQGPGLGRGFWQLAADGAPAKNRTMVAATAEALEHAPFHHWLQRIESQFAGNLLYISDETHKPILAVAADRQDLEAWLPQFGATGDRPLPSQGLLEDSFHQPLRINSLDHGRWALFRDQVLASQLLPRLTIDEADYVPLPGPALTLHRAGDSIHDSARITLDTKTGSVQGAIGVSLARRILMSLSENSQETVGFPSYRQARILVETLDVIKIIQDQLNIWPTPRELAHSLEAEGDYRELGILYIPPSASPSASDPILMYRASGAEHSVIILTQGGQRFSLENTGIWVTAERILRRLDAGIEDQDPWGRHRGDLDDALNEALRLQDIHQERPHRLRAMP